MFNFGQIIDFPDPNFKQALIDEEDPNKVLSDDKIVTILKAENIDIARRTVAKYREALHIPSSVQRRKQKKNQ